MIGPKAEDEQETVQQDGVAENGKSAGKLALELPPAGTGVEDLGVDAIAGADGDDLVMGRGEFIDESEDVGLVDTRHVRKEGEGGAGEEVVDREATAIVLGQDEAAGGGEGEAEGGGEAEAEPSVAGGAVGGDSASGGDVVGECDEVEVVGVAAVGAAEGGEEGGRADGGAPAAGDGLAEGEGGDGEEGEDVLLGVEREEFPREERDRFSIGAGGPLHFHRRGLWLKGCAACFRKRPFQETYNI